MKITEELKIITEDIIKVIKLHQITSRELYKNAEWDDFLEYQKEAAQEDVLYDVDIDQTAFEKVYENTMNEKASILYENGLNYYNGTSVTRQNKKRAAVYFCMAAEKGHVLGQFNIAYMFYNGEGVERDYTEAFYWFYMVAANGNERGYYFIADFYMQGLGIIRENHAKAAVFYQKSAKMGSPAGMYNYAVLLAQGDGVEENTELALSLLRESAGRGFKQAVDAMKAVEKNDDAAKGIMQSVDIMKDEMKLMNEQQLYQYLVTYISYDVMKNYYMFYAAFCVICDELKKEATEVLNKIFDLYQRAKQAMYLIERWNFESEEFDAKKYVLEEEYAGSYFLKNVDMLEKSVFDVTGFMKYLSTLEDEARISLVQGETTAKYVVDNEIIAEEAFLIANLLIENKFSKPLSVYAADFYLIAAILSKPEAQYELGLCYRWGTGGKYVDADRAIYWFKRAMENGVKEAGKIVEAYDSESGRNILRMSAISGKDGFGTKWYKDQQLVKEYYRKADEGDMEARYELARVLVPDEEYGAFKRSASKAAYYYELAAGQGSVDAAFNLANLYEYGALKFDVNLEKAFYWRKKCADMGDTEACHLVSKMFYEGKGTQKDEEMGRFYEKKKNGM